MSRNHNTGLQDPDPGKNGPDPLRTGWFWEILGGPFSKTYLAILNVINAETDDELEFWIVGNLEELNSFSREGNIGRIYLFPALF